MDTGAHPNSIANDLLTEQWTVDPQAAEKVRPCFTLKDSIDVIEKTNLHVRIGDSSTQAILHIVDKPAVNFLPVASFIDET